MDNNSAIIGGCIYYDIMIPRSFLNSSKINQKQQSDNNTFSNNLAQLFGSNIGSPSSEIYLTSIYDKN